jgi:spermidine synthase
MLVVLGVVASNTLTWLEKKQGIVGPPFRISNTELFFMLFVAVVFAIFIRTFEIPSLYANQVTLFEMDGQYGHIRIYEQSFSLDRPPLRGLQREVNSDSAIFQDSYEHVFGYARFADVYQTIQSTTTNYLMLGGGAFTIPRSLVATNPTIQVDVSELEPILFSLSQEYFDLYDTSRINNHDLDARVFLQQTEKKYDVIFADAFNSGHYIPYHLTSREFFEAVRDRLADDGLFIANFIGARNQPDVTLTGSFAKTVQSVFPNVRLFSFGIDSPDTRQNLVFIAQKKDGGVDISNTSVPNDAGEPVFLADIEIPLDSLNLDEQIIFTDDYAPIEYLVAKQLYNL